MASNTAAGKRASVLVTDSRERPRVVRPPPPGSGAPHNRLPTRLISVDNVLQYASEIPSGQARGPPGRRPMPASQRRPNAPPTSVAARTGQQNLPVRSTKISEKLVLIPESRNEKKDQDENELVSEEGPLNDTEMDVLKKRGGVRGKTYAERLPKQERAEKLSRVTAYCTAQAYKMKATANFVKETHGARTKLYDDCLYTVYHLPLLPGSEGFRVRSSPVLKSPGGKAVLDEEIDRNERRDYHEGYFEDREMYGVRGGNESLHNESEDDRTTREEAGRRSREEAHSLAQGRRTDSPNRVAPDATTFAEMFVFSYGVVVFWNFTARQEKDILADLSFSEHELGISLITRPHDLDDYEMEELHFEYNPRIERPRVFNDMITLRSGDHMIKLAMSHAISQSTKLSFFEERMSKTMADAQYIPKNLALTGQLGISRTEMLKILGRLFKSRMDVNLSSNILDIPDFFWESEPLLRPLHEAVREYLEIGPRIQVLNERCEVFLDFTKILSDSIADGKMKNITWIIIALIVISIAVTVSEVGLRFGMLSKNNVGGPGMVLAHQNFTSTDFTIPQLEAICGMLVVGQTFVDI
ncbi:hypothetical protein BJ878DRAFT_488140 [Calycina marina]|uniref:DUF155 domain-containing protein n=1 Tax=Calycina marina TaxID=1763456 RepID=A0A9P8CKF0_9HELO|nr:hypothetical protein BJ878DRAFT_488140 [Calycina marina]